MYVQRDGEGKLVCVSREPTAICDEFMAPDDQELLAFLSDGSPRHEQSQFHASDLAFVRVLEDVLDLLMDKGVISFTDLPEAARRKIMDRQSLRRRYNDVDLVGGDDDPLI
ncbi:tryptophan synthase subunit beta like protein [Halomonas denitrificans]|uniref:tryptophan synthase subunit beta like protein n=1 Tax=Halomonas TaxID=2745 RepID=UPI001A8F96C9|nr:MULTISPECIES: tryptophan synthase subunit beta like protein [Halomonas]MEE3214215.1 tryptophan synthase subunit beta like protein [Pseudomonadota bacterium]MBN8411025.1 tryptophan synthase subunit beta like protein [Halomonas litopenaei]MBY5927231.1 tryptophan synthase subunit beta like protein [Halomonas sp. DP4Y7-2]MBY5929388.1 tryptophan synthase subunit beta like protein [Halomonas sp. DP8Y7-3]MBY5970472.1 tryptophan synthase subunit beta like protein [Halomonas denitrificans]